MLSGAARQSGFPPLVGCAVSYRAYIIPQADPIIFPPFPRYYWKNNVSWSRPDPITQSEVWLAGEPLRLGLTVPTADPTLPMAPSVRDFVLRQSAS